MNVVKKTHVHSKGTILKGTRIHGEEKSNGIQNTGGLSSFTHDCLLQALGMLKRLLLPLPAKMKKI